MDKGVEKQPARTDSPAIDYLDFVSAGSFNKREPKSNSPPEKPATYLEQGIDSAVSLAISDPYLRGEFGKYGSSFATTAALFARGKAGWIATPIVFGLANTKPETTLFEKAEDFGLGAAKGLALKGLYHSIGQTNQFAPTKGMLMGLTSRGTDAVFQRDLLTDPSIAWERLRAEASNRSALTYDALTWTLGEGIFSGTNYASGGALTRNKYISGMFMGATFGVINGGSQEISRQQSTGATTIDWQSVIGRGLLQGGVDATAAGFGIAATDRQLHAGISKIFKSQVTDLGQTVTLSIALSEQPEKRGAKPIMEIRRTPQSFSADQLGQVDSATKTKPHQIPLEGNAKHMLLIGPDGAKLKLKTAAINLSVFEQPGSESTTLKNGNTTISVMAPLLIGDPSNPDGAASKPAWTEFDRQLCEAKKLGIHAVSTDVWWGLIEPKEGQFSWSYYDKMAQHITSAGLKWNPILSFHQCGGNIGDTVHIPVPEWIWTKLASRMTSGDARAVQYVSEQGNASKEYVSVWATHLVLDNYGNVMRNFQNHFAGRSSNIAEINISLGPAGELRYPSYNSHDTNTGYPTRGALQSYSELAIASFRQFALDRYGGIEGLQRAWNLPQLTAERINPPENPNDFFANQNHTNLQYGRDFFDWYNDSLLKHGRVVLGAAVKVFGDKTAPFFGINIGAKVPGVHWYVGERQGDNIAMNGRLAELTAGLIRTSAQDWTSDSAGRGYRPILSLFREFQPITSAPASRVVPAMTALELADGQDGKQAQSLPNTLAQWVGQEAQRQHLTLHGENALAFSLRDPASWDRMRAFLNMPSQQDAPYHGLTLLRLGDVVNDPIARARVSEIINAINSMKTQTTPVAAPATETQKSQPPKTEGGSPNAA